MRVVDCIMVLWELHNELYYGRIIKCLVHEPLMCITLLHNHILLRSWSHDAAASGKLSSWGIWTMALMMKLIVAFVLSNLNAICPASSISSICHLYYNLRSLALRRSSSGGLLASLYFLSCNRITRLCKLGAVH
jgi:hypothetical protein